MQLTTNPREGGRANNKVEKSKIQDNMFMHQSEQQQLKDWKLCPVKGELNGVVIKKKVLAKCQQNLSRSRLIFLFRNLPAAS